MRSETKTFPHGKLFLTQLQYAADTVKWSLDDFSQQDDKCMSKDISDLQLFVDTYSNHSILYLYTYIFHGSTEALLYRISIT